MNNIVGTSINKIFGSCMLAFALLAGQVAAQPRSGQEAALTKRQQEFVKWQYGIFLHFNMAAYVNKEWATGYEDPLLFKPGKLDCAQWAATAKAAGMKYGVLTVKHTGGWCLWDSKYTTHDITAFKNYKNGHGDIVREFVNAFRKQGLKEACIIACRAIIPIPTRK